MGFLSLVVEESLVKQKQKKQKNKKTKKKVKILWPWMSGKFSLAFYIFINSSNC